MKKMSKKTRSNLLNALLIVGTIGAVLIIGSALISEVDLNGRKD